MNQNKILVIGPNWVGDMVMAQSLFKLIKQRQPAAQIDVLAPAWSQSLLSSMPEIRQSFVAPFDHGQLRLSERYHFAKKLRDDHYDQAIVLPNSFKSALIPFFAKIPQRTGDLGEMRWGLLNDVRYLNKQKYPLMIERFAALGLSANETMEKKLPWPALVMQSEAQQETLKKFSLNHRSQPILGICPGAEYGPAKRWPAHHFAKVVEEKTKAGWQVWIFGSAKDTAIAAEIQSLCDHQAIDLTGKTSLAEAIHLLSVTTAVITNDSGLMHVAAALDKPLVAIYGSSSDAFTPPLSKKAVIVSLRLACHPCFKRECPLGHLKCLQELPPSKVLGALESLSQIAHRNRLS